MKELREQNATGALAWARANQEALDQIGSDLLFNLHQARLSALIKRSVDLQLTLKILKAEAGIKRQGEPNSETLGDLEIERTKLSNEAKELNNQIVTYARKELCVFSQKYHAQICRLMGSIVQVDFLAEAKFIPALRTPQA